MNTELTWKKGWFSCAYQILAGDMSVGALKEKTFQRASIGAIGNKRYKFRTKGILKPYTEIIDLDEHQVIGRISFSCWMPKATVQLGEQTMYWRYQNLWETKWELNDFEGNRLAFKGCQTKGKVTMTNKDELMVLVGLFISNYYQKMTTVFIAAILPILLFI